MHQVATTSSGHRRGRRIRFRSGQGCVANWTAVVFGSVQPGEPARCLATVLLTSMPRALAMLAMLCHGAVLRPTAIVALGALFARACPAAKQPSANFAF